MGKGLCHDLFQHLYPVLSGHFLSFWLLVFLCLCLDRLISSVYYNLTTELFSISYEILCCQVDLYSFEFVEDIHFCDKILDHEGISQHIFSH